MKCAEVGLHRYTALGQATVILIAWFVPSFDHPLWPSLKFSIIIISTFFLALHLSSYISITIKRDSKKYKSSERLVQMKWTASILQKASLLGLGIIIIGLFIVKDNVLTGSGIAILLLMGVEFLAHTWSIWNLEEDARRNSKN